MAVAAGADCCCPWQQMLRSRSSKELSKMLHGSGCCLHQAGTCALRLYRKLRDLCNATSIGLKQTRQLRARVICAVVIKHFVHWELTLVTPGQTPPGYIYKISWGISGVNAMTSRAPSLLFPRTLLLFLLLLALPPGAMPCFHGPKVWHLLSVAVMLYRDANNKALRWV